MFNVYCLRTEKTLTLDKTTVLIILRQFDDGYEQFFHVCNMKIYEDRFIYDDKGNLFYDIKRIK